MTFRSTFALGLMLTAATPLAVWAGAAPPPKKSGMTSFAITSAQLSSAKDQQAGKLVEFEIQDNVRDISVSRNAVTVQKP
ncbi:MAG: hypothetical protein ACKN9E_16235, partial [Microcystaceae cyanobacterium]